MNEGY